MSAKNNVTVDGLDESEKLVRDLIRDGRLVFAHSQVDEVLTIKRMRLREEDWQGCPEYVEGRFVEVVFTWEMTDDQSHR